MPNWHQGVRVSYNILNWILHITAYFEVFGIFWHKHTFFLLLFKERFHLT